MDGPAQPDTGADEIAAAILARLRRSKRKHNAIEQIAAKVDASRAAVNAAIDRLAESGELVRTRKGKIALTDRLGLLTGIVRAGRGGRAVVVLDDPDAPIALPRGAVRPAMNGDRVLVEASPYTRGGLRTGRIQQVLERRTKVLLGTLTARGDGAPILLPLDARTGYVATLSEDSPRAQAGVVVEAEIVEYPTSYRDPIVRITAEIGPAGALATEIEGICRGMGIPREFAAETLEQAAALRPPDESEAAGRLDLRETYSVTIDPADARDHDDAVAIDRTDRGFRLTVSIADVSHYVRPRSALDDEAYERGTSTYFPGTCVPMLPERLSAGLASLRPGEDRLAVSAILELDDAGHPLEVSFARSIIRSHKSLSYEEVQRALDGDGSQDADLYRRLQAMAECATAMRASRMARGAIDLDVPEAEIQIGEDGQPASIQRRPRLESHRIIEEFMLAANEAVARELEQAGVPLIYRVHEKPDAQAIDSLATRLLPLGYRIDQRSDRLKPAVLQALVARAVGKPEQRLVNVLVLRSMQQARYSEANAGHFGLASAAYTHFTSPIRRYPDLVVHRQLCALLDNRAAAGGRREQLAVVAAHCSDLERRAMAAERDAVRACGVLLLQSHVGEEFDGTVTGVERYGYFVELDAHFVEGFVGVARLDDYYVYVADRVELQARGGGEVIRIGDRVRIRIDTADLAQRRLEFVPVRSI